MTRDITFRSERVWRRQNRGVQLVRDRDLVEAANDAGVIHVDDPRRAAALVQQTVMYSWFGNRLAQSSRARLSAETTWEFCLHGLNA
jgi:hypothetical protein